ncbi:SRPBCC domain-containing protein [Streptomyces sp. NPDC003077]|uniref:SRPBCC family protein n=1 Tax=Streptomyces sp. NPDC003077 TaxID=3154443 RepID=UPI0033A4DDCD
MSDRASEAEAKAHRGPSPKAIQEDAPPIPKAPGQGISLARVLDAPRARVYRAWTTPEDFARWFGGRLEVPVERLTMDVRPGGRWSLVMRTPDGGHLPFFGVYQEVAEPERLVFSLKDTTSAEESTGEIVTLLLTDLGDRTEMVFHQGGGHLSAEEYRRSEEGWAGFFDRLADLLAEENGTPSP